MLKSKLYKFFYQNDTFFEWVFRILFSINLLMPGINFATASYPLSVLGIVLAAFWLNIFRLNKIAILFLLLALLINCQHLNQPYSD